MKKRYFVLAQNKSDGEFWVLERVTIFPITAFIWAMIYNCKYDDVKIRVGEI